MTDEERAFQPRVTVGSRVPCLSCSGSGVNFWIDGVTWIKHPVVCPACDGSRQQTVIEPPPPEEVAG